MTHFRLLGDQDLEEAIAKIERTIAHLATVDTVIADGLRRHYQAVLAEASAESEKRARVATVGEIP
jgi:hypothetical protein